MNILLIHNYYQQPGGEDLAFENEAALLETYGHRVIRFRLDNKAVDRMSRLTLLTKTHFNTTIYQQIREIVRQENIQICHFHNTFPLISPAAYYAAKREGAAVVQTLHNFRTICPAATLYRDGHVCEECLNQLVPWPSVMHGCYRESRTTTAVVASMLSAHRFARTWARAVDTYIALTEFARDKFIQGGLPGSKITIKKNFLEVDPGSGPGDGNYALFIGRLVPEKGVQTMLSAWKQVGLRLPLKIIGGGPMANDVKQAAIDTPGVEYMGRVPSKDLDLLLGRASFLLFPSEWYEGLPRTIIEAFAKGTPVVASDIGSMSALIDHGRTGLKFSPGSPNILADLVLKTLQDKAVMSLMRSEARREFDANYTAERNYSALLNIYQRVIPSATPTRRRLNVSESAQSTAK